MTTRHDQLFSALTIARQTHRKDPSEANFRALAAARVPMLEFNTAKNKLEDALFDAKRNGPESMRLELEARLAELMKPHDDRAKVKLVDTAGTLRLDLNDRRVHMTREQALELFVELGAALDTSPGEETTAIQCCAFPSDFLQVYQVDSEAINVQPKAVGERTTSINLSKRGAVELAVDLVSRAKEMTE